MGDITLNQDNASASSQQDSFATSAFASFFFWGVCSALAITVCTFVDALLVGNLVGSDGLAVTNLSTPLFLAFGLFGIVLGVGGNVLMGKQLGGSAVEKAQKTFHALLWIGLAVGVTCMVICIPLGTSICGFLGADNTLLPLAQAYITPVLYAAPLFVLYHILSLSVRTDGDPQLAAIAAAVVILTNLSLDILLMQVLKIGIRGASLSLCIAEGLGVCVLLTHFFKKHSLLTLGLKKPTVKQLRTFVTNGFGVGSALLFQGLVMLWFNSLLLQNTTNGVFHVAVFGVIYTIGLVPGAFFDGGSNALSTVVSIFCGEKDKASVLVVLRCALVSACVSGGVFMVPFALFANQILAFFGLSGQVTADAVLAVRLFACSLILTGIHVSMIGFWQAIGRPRLASNFSIARNCVLMLVIGAIFIPFLQIIGLAITYCLAELVSIGITMYIYHHKNSGDYLTQCYKTVNRTYERYYPIQAESMSQIATDLESICEAWDMSMKQSFFINLIVEELVLNIMKFGLDGSHKQHYIAIKLLNNGDEYILRIRDNVKTYNPFDSQGDDIDAGAIRLITTKASYYDYQRKLIFNYLYLIL